MLEYRRLHRKCGFHVGEVTATQFATCPKKDCGIVPARLISAIDRRRCGRPACLTCGNKQHIGRLCNRGIADRDAHPRDAPSAKRTRENI